MTRKARKSRKSRKTKSRRYKGGAFLAAGLGKGLLKGATAGASTVGDGAYKVASGVAKGASFIKQKIPGLGGKSKYSGDDIDLKDVISVLKFSFGAIIMSPLYIATVLANMPLNTLHNLSGKRIDDAHSDAVGIQLYKYMFEGYKKGPEEKGLIERIGEHKDRFEVPKGTKVRKNIIAKCDDCQKGFEAEKPENKPPDQKPENKPQVGAGIQRGGYMDTFKTFDEIMGFKPFNGVKGVLGEMGFKKYKDQIAKSVAHQNTQLTHKLREFEFEVDSIKDTFVKRKDELKGNIRNIKTELLFKSIVVCQTLITECVETTVNKKVKVTKDMVVVSNPYRRVYPDSSHFKMEVCFLNNNCKEDCENCTLFDNIVSIYHSYARILLSTLRGKNNNLYVIIDMLFNILKNGIGGGKPVINLDDTSTMKYPGPTEHIKQELEKPIELFKALICEYGLYAEMKKKFEYRVKEMKDPEEKRLLLLKLQSII